MPCNTYNPYQIITTNCQPCTTGCLSTNSSDCVFLKNDFVKCDNSVFPKGTTSIEDVLSYLKQITCTSTSKIWTNLSVNVVTGTSGATISPDLYMTAVVGNEPKCAVKDGVFYLKGKLEINYSSAYMTAVSDIDEFISSNDLVSPKLRCLFTTCTRPTVDKHFKINVIHPFLEDTPITQVVYRHSTLNMILKTNGEIVSNGTIYSNNIQNASNVKPSTPGSGSPLYPLKATIYFDDIAINLD